MTVRTFVDSNILIYAHDLDAGPKHAAAAERIAALWSTSQGTLSTQVLQEFYVNVTQKIKRPLSRAAAREVVRDYTPWIHSLITGDTIIRASEISEVWRLSFWDSMILTGAEQSNARILLTEDLNHGQFVAGIEIENPFR
ncbi:MAG TPA: PIN domain-containing protein [Candidatus Solibacter sp.]|nr:PIN domain-containing protein [Candidatus Solibacter sp.]